MVIEKEVDLSVKLLITGGCGFIGSNFIRHILKSYPTYKVYNLDKLTYSGNPDNLKDIENNPNYIFIKMDICDIQDFPLDPPDWIVNFAAESHVDRSIRDSSPFIKSNYLGVQKLLDYAVQHDCKFFQISTDEVYGEVLDGFADENSLLKPSSPYSASKAGADLLVQAYGRTYGLKYIISRSTNNFGPYQYPEKLIPLAITNLLENKKVPIYGKGDQIRNWIFVEDNCKAIDLLLHEGKFGEIYNIGSLYDDVTNYELIKFIIENMALDYEYFIEFVPDRPGHDRRYAVDCKKITELGFEIKDNLETNLNKTINWYINNEWWWKKLKLREDDK